MCLITERNMPPGNIAAIPGTRMLQSLKSITEGEITTRTLRCTRDTDDLPAQVASEYLQSSTINAKFGNNYMNMTDPSFLSTTETFHTPSLGDEVLEIPPIGSLPEGDPAALGMVEAVQGFVGLDDGMTGTQGADFAPHFPPQSLELPAITISGGLLAQDHGMHGMSMAPSEPSPVYMHGVHMSVGPVLSAQERPPPVPTLMHAHGALTTIDQSHLRAQLGLGLGSGGGMPHGSPSPPGSQSATPSPSSSLNDEDPEELNRLAMEKRQMVDLNRKAKTNKKKKKTKDPNEPQKPVSAYALFFRDTQAAIKGQNPSATFGEVSKIVASMWDSLGEEQKQVYKRKAEAAKKEYLKALSAYRDGLVSQTGMDGSDMDMMSHQNQAPAHSVASQMLAASAPMPPPLHPMPQVASKLTAAGQMSVAMSSMPPPPPLMTAPHYQQRLVAAQQQQQQMLMEPHSLLQQQQQQQQQQQMMVSQQMPPPPTPPLQPQSIVADQPMLLHQQQQQTIVVQSHESQSLHLQELSEESHPSQHLVAEVEAEMREEPFPPNQVVTMDISNTTCANSMSAIQTSSSDVRHGSVDIVSDGQIAGGDPMLAPDSRGSGLIGEIEMTSVASPVQAYPQNFSPAEALMVPSPHRSTLPEMCALPKCVRMGCTNPPVASVDWDNEFCSSECVVSHCRDVFMAWVASRVQGSPASVK